MGQIALMLIVDVNEAKTQFSLLLERAHAGEEVIIALAAREPRVPGLLKGQLDPQFFEPLPEEELDVWKSEK